MTIHLALIIVGILDALMGVLFWWTYRRTAATLRVWPDPGPWGADREVYEKLRGTAENFRVLRVVCINTGASMITAGILML